MADKPGPISPQNALIYVMVVMSAADSEMTDRELRAIGEIVRLLPVFEGFDQTRLVEVARQCAELLSDENGLDTVMRLVREVLPERLFETAYALACDVAVADGHLEQEELRLLDLIREGLGIDRLNAVAIERGCRAHYMRL
jgi:tellurite resistance protein